MFSGKVSVVCSKCPTLYGLSERFFGHFLRGTPLWHYNFHPPWSWCLKSPLHWSLLELRSFGQSEITLYKYIQNIERFRSDFIGLFRNSTLVVSASKPNKLFGAAFVYMWLVSTPTSTILISSESASTTQFHVCLFFHCNYSLAFPLVLCLP